MSPETFRRVGFSDASKLTRLGAGETPPADGWAIGPEGLFDNGQLVGRDVLEKPNFKCGDGVTLEWFIREDEARLTIDLVPSDHIDNLTEQALGVVRAANHEAHQIRWEYIGSEHLLLGILRGRPNVAATALSTAGIKLESAREEMLRLVSVEGGDPTDDQIALPFTPRAASVLRAARNHAARLGARLTAPEHLLLGIIVGKQSLATQILRGLGADLNDLAARVEG